MAQNSILFLLLAAILLAVSAPLARGEERSPYESLEIVDAIEDSFAEFMLSSHLNVVLVSDSITDAQIKNLEYAVSRFSRRQAEITPYKYVHEKVVFHINRDSTLISQVNELYSNNKVAVTETVTQVEVPRPDMESILQEHYHRSSTTTTLYVFMIENAINSYNVSYINSKQSKSDCRRKAFLSTNNAFAWIDVFASDSNLIFMDSLREYDNLDFRSSRLLHDSHPDNIIHHLTNVILQSSEYLITFPSSGLFHNAGIYNVSSTNRIDILAITICEDSPCQYDENALLAAEAVMKTYSIPGGLSASGRNNGLDFSISQVKFSIAENPALLVAWADSVSFPKASLPGNIRFGEENSYRNSVEKSVNSKRFLASLLESKVFSDTIISHLPLDLNSDSVKLLPVISIVTSNENNMLSHHVSGDKGTIAIDSDTFHWNNVVVSRELNWRFKKNQILYSNGMKNDDHARNSNSLPNIAIIAAFPQSGSSINGHSNSSIKCGDTMVPFSDSLLSEFLFYSIRGAILGEDDLLAHYSRMNHRFTIDSTWFTPSFVLGKSQIDSMNLPAASTFRERRYIQRNIIFGHLDHSLMRIMTALRKLVNFDSRINLKRVFDFNNVAMPKLSSRSRSKAQKIQPENEKFEVLKLNLSPSNMKAGGKSGKSSSNLYENFIFIIQETSNEFSYLEFNSIMNNLKLLDGLTEELESVVDAVILEKVTAIECPI